ncbi:CHAT domain-containing protein [Thermodesulfobacteriota bacterium]
MFQQAKIPISLYIKNDKHNPSIYHCRLKTPDNIEVREDFRFLSPNEYIKRIAIGGPVPTLREPFFKNKLGQTFIEIINRSPGKCQVEICLYPDLTAALPWEEIVEDFEQMCAAVRRPMTFYAPFHQRLLPRNKFPYNYTIIALTENFPVYETVTRFQEFLRKSRWNNFVKVRLLQEIDSIRACSEYVLKNRADFVHIIGEPEIIEEKPKILLGKQRVLLENLLKGITNNTFTRSLIVQDVHDDTEIGIAAARIAAQRLPQTSDVATILCQVPAKHPNALETVAGICESVPKSKELAQYINYAKDRVFDASIVAPTNTVSIARAWEDYDSILMDLYKKKILGDRIQNLIEAKRTANWRQERILARNAEVLVARAQEVAAKRITDRGVTVVDVTELKQDCEDIELSSRTSQQIQFDNFKKEAEEPLPRSRYPEAAFFMISDADEQQISENSTLSLPPEGFHLEFRFWFDVIKGGGIPHLGESVQFTPPNDQIYPIKLNIDVWSQDFEIPENKLRASLTLERSGPTELACFPVELPADVPSSLREDRRGVLFVFVRHENELLAVFRAEAMLTTDPIRGSKPLQWLEYAFLKSNWFQFQDKPLKGSTLTLYLRKEFGQLQVFTLESETRPWGHVADSTQNFYPKTKRIYLTTTEMALEAAKRENQGGKPNSAIDAKKLAERGYDLYSSLFLGRSTPDVKQLVREKVNALPEGSTLTIAIDKNCTGLIIPWGLIYDEELPLGATTPINLNGFWGCRFKLSVQPYMHPNQLMLSEPCSSPVIGTIHLERPETKTIGDLLSDFQKKRKIQRVHNLTVQPWSIPDLVKRKYDLLHFFCHGNTEVEDLALGREIKKIQEKYQDVFEYLSKGDDSNVTGSYIYSSGGFAKLSSLQANIDELIGSPIVLLSMCESAQVTCSGDSFISFFLDRGARTVIGTEGPSLWSLSKELDSKIITALLNGKNIQDALWEARKDLVEKNALVLIYTLFGNGNARLVNL